MKMQFGLGVVAATLFIGCDDDGTSAPADSVDASEVSDTASVSEVTPEVAEVTAEVAEVTDEVTDLPAEVASIELTGSWTTEFGEETISETRWDGFCLQAIASFDNDENVAILETTGGEGCGTGFARVIWKDIVADAFDYCTTTYGATTAEAAASAPTDAVSDDLETGCGGFPWSHLTRK